jgi:cytosine/adenosine deaminase-related metal-dependent hydrolase
MTAIYSARWVLPITSPAIDFGAVAVKGDTIIAIGSAARIVSEFPEAQLTDFGKSAILPGFVNAHSHLELTVMRGFLEGEEHDFFSWLRKLTVARMAMDGDDLFVSSACGAIEAVRAGITCLGDSSSAAKQTMKANSEVGLRAVVYQESFGPDPNLAEQAVAGLRRELEAMRAIETSTVRAGVSPHAPYTVSARQLKLIAQLAIEDRLPLMMHAAESPAERSLMIEGTGAFADGLRKRNIEWEVPRSSTIQYLARHGLMATRPLLAHCITVDDQDIETIHANGASIAHCPRSNAKLRHGRAPFAKFLEAELKVGLGSDSVASNNNCDILEEARFAVLAARSADSGARADTLNAEAMLFAATLGGARALGLDHEIGSLRAGMQADLAVIGLDGVHQQPITNPADALIFSSSGRDVRMTMVAGKEICRDGQVAGIDANALFPRLAAVRDKLEEAAANARTQTPPSKTDA